MTETIEPTAKAETIPEATKTRGRIRLFEVSGIQVTIDYSWLIIFLLVIWSLSSGYFPYAFGKEYNATTYWIAGFVATVLFFASIVIHELSHSLTAVRCGLLIPEITLFIFGGVAQLSKEPDDPRMELKIATAGPLASFVLAAIFWVIMFGLEHIKAPKLIIGVFQYLSWINVALAVFNLVPGYPLDGGRILRALVWWKTGSLASATKWASDVGKGFAWALMILGGYQIFMGHLIGGLWLILIGMFLRAVAASGYEEVIVKQSLGGVRVEEVMVHDVVAAPPELTLDRLVHDYFLKYGHGGFPVVRQGEAVGLISLAQIKGVPEEDRKTKTVADVMIPLSEEVEIEPRASLVDALRKMSIVGIGRLLVMQAGRMVGMITKTGLLRFLEIKRVLEE